MAKALTDKQKMMKMKTSSKIPKTPAQKRKWERARQLVAKQVGRYSEKEIPWGLVNKIYKNEEKGNKTITPKDIKETKKSSTVRKYKVAANPRKKIAMKRAAATRAMKRGKR